MDTVLNCALPTPQQDKTTLRHGTLGTAALEMLFCYNMSNSKREKRSSRVEPDWFRISQEFNCDQISYNNSFDILIHHDSFVSVYKTHAAGEQFPATVYVTV